MSAPDTTPKAKTPQAPRPARPTRLVAGSRPQALVPKTLDEALVLAKAIVASGMAPQGLDTPEACMVAILHGLEVGLTPLMALQRITVIDGRPTLWGDAALALVRASGLLNAIRETVEGSSPETWVASCAVLRVGEAEPVTRTFSREEARQAGLWGRPGPWSTYPRRMLQMRARAFALRDVFPDVLGGLYLREEIEEEDAPFPEANGPGEPQAPPTVGPQRRTRAPASAARPHRTRGGGWVRLRPPREAIRLRAPAPPGFPDADDPTGSGPSPIEGSARTAQADLDLYDQALACASDEATLREIEEEFAGRLANLSRETAAQALRLRERHQARVADLLREGQP